MSLSLSQAISALAQMDSPSVDDLKRLVSSISEKQVL